MTPKERMCTVLAAAIERMEASYKLIRDGATELRIARELCQGVKGDSLEAEKQAAEETLSEATSKHDALLKKLADMPTNLPAESDTPGEVKVGVGFVNLQPAPPVNWDRWHDLLDIKDERGLTPDEEGEYQRFTRIVAQLDAEGSRAADAGLDNLAKEHERVIASTRRLTAAVRAAAKQHDCPAPPIAVEMRVRQVGQGVLGSGYWIAGPAASVTHSSSNRETAIRDANTWLSALSEKLGVRLEATWEGEEPATADGE